MLAHLIRPVRNALQSRGTAAFLIAALLVGVLVGLGAALLVTLIEAVGDVVDPLREGQSGWPRLGRWAALIALPAGVRAS